MLQCSKSPRGVHCLLCNNLCAGPRAAPVVFRGSLGYGPASAPFHSKPPDPRNSLPE